MVLLCSTPAFARDGFSVSLGLGGGVWHLDAGSLSSSLQEINRPGAEGGLLTRSLADGLAVRFSMTYAIRGYASVEIGMTGHGWNLGGDDLGGSGHVSLVAHFHPLQFWFPEREVDATVFLGGGYSILGGGQSDDDNSRGLDGGMLEFGFSGRYFFTPWMSLGGEVRFTVPVYQRWFVDWSNDVEFDLDSAPDALFVALLATVSFHFSPAN